MKYKPNQRVRILKTPIADASGQEGVVVVAFSDGFAVAIPSQNRTIFCEEHELELLP